MVIKTCRLILNESPSPQTHIVILFGGEKNKALKITIKFEGCIDDEGYEGKFIYFLFQIAVLVIYLLLLDLISLHFLFQITSVINYLSLLLVLDIDI